jgi:hypothetical protein
MNSRKVTSLVAAAVLAAALVFTAVGYAVGVGAHKEKLPRMDVYYDITNDADDEGNFILQFKVPYQGDRSRTVYCLAYKDHSKDAGGVSLSCDWVGFHKTR